MHREVLRHRPRPASARPARSARHIRTCVLILALAAGPASRSWAACCDGLQPDDPRWDPRFGPPHPAVGTVVEAVFYDGELYAASDQGRVCGVTTGFLARWDGRRWRDVGGGVNGLVRSLAVIGDDLYVGGDFSMAGTTPARRIARWDGASWHALGSGMSGGGVDAIVGKDGFIYAGGSFSDAGGVANTAALARWNGSSWEALAGGPLVGGSFVPQPYVRSLAVHGSDLVLGGRFLRPSSATLFEFLARWDGASFALLGGDTDNDVLALLPDGGDLVVAGQFTRVDRFGTPQIAVGIARWNGTSWNTMAGGTSGTVKALLRVGTDLYVGGTFRAVGFPASKLARWDGSSWHALPISWDIDAAGVEALASLGTIGDGDDRQGLFAGGGPTPTHGYFPPATGLLLHGVVRWDGSHWHGLCEGLSREAFALEAAGEELYAGGAFLHAGGRRVNHVARWDGRRWHGVGGGTDARVLDVAVAGSDVYVAGDFGQAGGVPASRVARWNGVAWDGLGGGLANVGLGGGPARATTLLAAAGGVYVGGHFDRAGGVPVNRLAFWDGASWHDVGGGVNGDVQSLAFHEGRLYVGGSFSLAGATAVSNVAAWDGSLWDPLGGGLGGAVLALVSGGGAVHAGGDGFLVAAWNGTSWMNLAGGRQGTANALAFGAQGDLYAGGPFIPIGTVDGCNVARYRSGAWTTLGSGHATPFPEAGIIFHSVQDVAVLPTGHVAVGGNFQCSGGRVSWGFDIYEEPMTPTPTLLRWFGARLDEDAVALEWQVEDEAVAGFRILRGDATAGPRPIHAGLLPADRRRHLDRDAPRDEPLHYELQLVGSDGATLVSGTTAIRVPGPALSLVASPNPFARSTDIAFVLPRAGPVDLAVFDARGRRVATLTSGAREAGDHVVRWDGADAAGRPLRSGTYFVRLAAGGASLTRKLSMVP